MYRQSRSAPALARGGFQNNFETQVELFRRSNDGLNKFSRTVSPGAVVQLGEELLLRAAVRDGDGMTLFYQTYSNCKLIKKCK